MNGNAIESEITMDMLKDAMQNNRQWRSTSLNLNAAESLLFEPLPENAFSGDLSRRAVLGRPGNRYSEGENT
jgi:glycine/serine hydroxymethyltransferase